MSGQRRANWRAEAAQMVAMEAEARVTGQRSLLNELTDLSRSLTVACQDAAEHRKRIENLERWAKRLTEAVVACGISCVLLIAWAVTR